MNPVCTSIQQTCTGIAFLHDALLGSGMRPTELTSTPTVGATTRTSRGMTCLRDALSASNVADTPGQSCCEQDCAEATTPKRIGDGHLSEEDESSDEEHDHDEDSSSDEEGDEDEDAEIEEEVEHADDEDEEDEDEEDEGAAEEIVEDLRDAGGIDADGAGFAEAPTSLAMQTSGEISDDHHEVDVDFRSSQLQRQLLEESDVEVETFCVPPRHVARLTSRAYTTLRGMSHGGGGGFGRAAHGSGAGGRASPEERFDGGAVEQYYAALARSTASGAGYGAAAGRYPAGRFTNGGVGYGGFARSSAVSVKLKSPAFDEAGAGYGGLGRSGAGIGKPKGQAFQEAPTRLGGLVGSSSSTGKLKGAAFAEVGRKWNSRACAL